MSARHMETRGIEPLYENPSHTVSPITVLLCLFPQGQAEEQAAPFW